MLYNIPLIDWLALTLFVLCWITYTWYADHSRWAKESLPSVMNFHRHRWMRETLKRDLRVPDTIIMGTFVQGAVFFASSAILVIGGLVASLGSSAEALEVITSLPFISTTTQGLWELKVVVLITVFIYAFVKFIWAVRLANYSSILFSAAPFNNGRLSEEYAVELGNILGLSGLHFNQGLRTYFFALATLGWWINPYFFIASTCTIVWVLYRREFRSKSLRAVNQLKRISIENHDV
ncbi:MAG: putative membrane protein [Gammaproteobacteria bacterium]|jgi:uncharacterized membrane protein